ncbi:kinase-like domain-containing protein, partial [Suillus subalutaceus]|uniref:kinase-like domain-containing protein n=1 Tax=Suillus subalutaceus TaxID=48586 RepID=UPI001B85EF59
CRCELSLKTAVMLRLQMFDRIELSHFRGVVLRDIKPDNFAMGVGQKSHIVYLFDFRLAKLYVDPSTRAQMYRACSVGLETPRYSSYNVHFRREHSRRDDLETSCYISCIAVCHNKASTHQATKPNCSEWRR